MNIDAIIARIEELQAAEASRELSEEEMNELTILDVQSRIWAIENEAH